MNSRFPNQTYCLGQFFSGECTQSTPLSNIERLDVHSRASIESGLYSRTFEHSYEDLLRKSCRMMATGVACGGYIFYPVAVVLMGVYKFFLALFPDLLYDAVRRTVSAAHG